MKAAIQRLRRRTPREKAILTFQQFQVVNLTIGVLWIGPFLYAAFSSTSIGLVADAVQHVVEVTFSFFVYLSLRAAQKSNALLFPHGTGKFEAIASSLLAISLVLSAVGILATGGSRLLDPVVPENSTLGIAFLSIALAINTTIYIASKPLERDGGMIVRVWRQMYLVDMFMKSTTILFVFVAKRGGIFVYLDPLAALMIGGVMLTVAIKALKDSVWELSDRAIEEDVQLIIMRELAEHFEAFDELVDVRTRRVGGRPVIEIEIGYYEDRSWPYVLESCRSLREKIETEISGARVVVIPTAAQHPALALQASA